MTTIAPAAPTPTPAPGPPVLRKVSTRASLQTAVVTSALTVGPVLGFAIAVTLMWGHAVHVMDLIMASLFYVITGFGVTIGFHRMLTHRSFRARRVLKIVLAIVGSMAIEGSATAWVANHRRHHMFSDQRLDPHSPHRFDGRPLGVVRGFLWAHFAWLFLSDATSTDRFAPDLVEDADLRRISKLFPVFAGLSLVLPLALGWTLTGTLSGAIAAFVWAGLVRMVALHHATWSVNSICHLFGKRPFKTKDESRNFAPLALVSFGESWHNFHHAFPSLARHGALRGQLDLSATLISLFERLGWVSKVRWPSPAQLAMAGS